MGDELDYKPMGNAVVIPHTLTIAQAVRAATASFRDDLHKIVGSEPIIEVESNGRTFILATYGAGKYLQMASFSIAEFPGNCGIAVFYHASVAHDFQHKGLGKLLLELRQEAARKAGYTIAMATVLKTNKAERTILLNAGWGEGSEFVNVRTKNTVVLYTKKLR
jgi:hypothetical protein